jgi:ATP diphosphatase
VQEMKDIQSLLAIMARLRNKDGGCPWDLAQDFSSIAPYTIEEAYEVADAIDRKDLPELKDELGDLLLQVVFHAQMASEQGAFDFGDVVASICQKMVRRHPHIFSNAQADDAATVNANWEAIKQAERQAKGEADLSALAGISRGLPEWQRALKLQSRAARVGFDWPQVQPVLAKLREEVDEVQAEFEVAEPEANRARLQEEIGDLLFVAANVARHAGVDPGTALRQANQKFERRFRAMEAIAEQRGTAMPELSLEAQEQLWDAVKAAEGDPQRS